MARAAKAAHIDERIAKLQAELEQAMQAKQAAEKAAIAKQDEQIIRLVRKHIADKFTGVNAQEFVAAIGSIAGINVPVPTPEPMVNNRASAQPAFGAFDEF